ncbi:hypothetical protein ASD62_02990 [Phycicoccus sp. Root563]|nr:hypothetical protein ASD62_02990 [Phycicoccus sp. Root563]
MSVDERLRSGLVRNARSLDPDVEVLLESALATHRRALWLRWGAATGGLVAAASAAIVLVIGGWGSDRDAPVLPAKTPTASVAIQGRYAGQVAALPTVPEVAGRWVLEFKAGGVLTVTAPPTYSGVVSGVLYAVQGQEMRTDLFSQDRCAGQPLGRYAVTRTGSRLALMAVDDPCAARVGVLGATAWTVAP